MEPNKAYGYAGKVCYCPINPNKQFQRPSSQEVLSPDPRDGEFKARGELINILRYTITGNAEEREELEAKIDELQSTIQRQAKEIEEQCRLNGMGAQRELKLLTVIEEAKKALEYYASKKNWRDRYEGASLPLNLRKLVEIDKGDVSTVEDSPGYTNETGGNLARETLSIIEAMKNDQTS